MNQMWIALTAGLLSGVLSALLVAYRNLVREYPLFFLFLIVDLSLLFVLIYYLCFERNN